MILARTYAELALYGFAASELDRDPRPSRLEALLEAGRVMDARRRLEDWEDRVNTEGAQGEVREEGGKPTPAPKTRTILVGYQRRQAELTRRAFPEAFTDTPGPSVDERRAQQQEKARSFWGSVGAVSAARVKVVDGVVVHEIPGGQP